MARDVLALGAGDRSVRREHVGAGTAGPADCDGMVLAFGRADVPDWVVGVEHRRPDHRRERGVDADDCRGGRLLDGVHRRQDQFGVGDDVPTGFQFDLGVQVPDGVADFLADDFHVQRFLVLTIGDAEAATEVDELQAVARRTDLTAHLRHFRDGTAVVVQVVVEDAAAGVGVDAHQVEALADVGRHVGNLLVRNPELRVLPRRNLLVVARADAWVDPDGDAAVVAPRFEAVEGVPRARSDGKSGVLGGQVDGVVRSRSGGLTAVYWSVSGSAPAWMARWSSPAAAHSMSASASRRAERTAWPVWAFAAYMT